MGQAAAGALLPFFIDTGYAFRHAAQLFVGQGDFFVIVQDLLAGPEMLQLGIQGLCQGKAVPDIQTGAHINDRIAESPETVR